MFYCIYVHTTCYFCDGQTDGLTTLTVLSPEDEPLKCD